MKNCRIPEQPNYDINLTNINSRFWINIGLIFFSYRKQESRFKVIIFQNLKRIIFEFLKGTFC